jgi:hypothetical protein
VLVAAGSFLLTRGSWKTAALALVSFHLHLLGDLVGGRGPDGHQWPIYFLFPFTRDCQLTWSGQWALNAWQNFLITALALAWTFFLAWKRGFSVLEIVSRRWDATFIATLRARWPRRPV